MADSRVQRPRRQTAGGRAGRVSPVWPDAGLCLRSHLVVRVVVVLVMMMESGASADRHKLMFLNSYVHCGKTDDKFMPNPVDQYSLYNIQDDSSPDTGSHAFLDCEMVFRSTRSDGHLCIFQRHLQFENYKVQLQLYDGMKDVDDMTHPNKTLDENHNLMSVEWCTNSRYLTIRMSAAGRGASVRDVHIDLLVYDLQSIHRKAYMDSLPSCDSSFRMLGSQVNVTNLDTSRAVKKHLYPVCDLQFEYRGEESGRVLCMVFQSLSHNNPGCRFNYTLKVFADVPETGQTLVSVRTCDKPFPRRWCSNSTKLRLELHRPVDTAIVEDDVVFHALILDHVGGPETLPMLESPSSASSPLPTETIIAIVLGCLAVFCVVIIIVIVVRCRRHRYGNGEQGDVGSGETMLGSSGNGHCRINGENHYTDHTNGTTPALV